MKNRHSVSADTYTVSKESVLFTSENNPTASIALFDNGGHANIQGTDDLLPIKNATILDNLDWLVLGFERDNRLTRLVVEFSIVDMNDLYEDLNTLFERANISFDRIPPLN